MRTRLPCMNEQALPVGWVVKSIFLRQGPSTPSFEIFDVTYPDPADAVEGVRRVCGDDRHRIIEVAEELVATDLGQIVPDQTDLPPQPSRAHLSFCKAVQMHKNGVGVFLREIDLRHALVLRDHSFHQLCLQFSRSKAGVDIAHGWRQLEWTVTDSANSMASTAIFLEKRLTSGELLRVGGAKHDRRGEKSRCQQSKSPHHP